MSYKTEFPDYDGTLYIPEGFIDNSWHNDVMPKATLVDVKSDGTEIIINIWQDYINEDLREWEGVPRYSFVITINTTRESTIIFDYRTDDLKKIKELVGSIYYDDISKGE